MTMLRPLHVAIIKCKFCCTFGGTKFNGLAEVALLPSVIFVESSGTN